MTRASRLVFVDADEALDQFMHGRVPDLVRFKACLLQTIAMAQGHGPIWIYGELVDVLCRQDNHAAALSLEQSWNAQCLGPGYSVLCGYDMDSFNHAGQVDQFRAICREHTHVIPTEQFIDARDDRARFEPVALLQQRAHALDVATVRPSVSGAPIVFVLDDDASVRRSLARLLSLAGMQVRTFESADALLEDADRMCGACLILDVQLVGLSGHDLQTRIAAEGWTMPVIAMSGSHDKQIETEALRLGALAFLRKPFDAQKLIDTVARALTV